MDAAPSGTLSLRTLQTVSLTVSNLLRFGRCLTLVSLAVFAATTLVKSSMTLNSISERISKTSGSFVSYAERLKKRIE